MINRKSAVKYLFAMLLAPSVSLFGDTFASDTFADGDRTNQDLPVSMAWFSGAGSDDLVTEQNRMTFRAAGSGRTIIGYFGTDRNGVEGVSLDDGDELKVSFTFYASGVVKDDTNSLRLGIFNSNTSTAKEKRVVEDGFGNGNRVFEGYTGYAVMFNPGSIDDSLRLYERTNAENKNLLNASSNFTEIGRVGVGARLASMNPYNAELTVSHKSNDEIEVRFEISGSGFGSGDYSITRAITGPITDTFDTIAINTTSGQLLDYSFTSFGITSTNKSK